MNHEVRRVKLNKYKFKVGDRVRSLDPDLGVGTIMKIENIHNVFVKYDNGGRGIHCLSRSKKCHRPQPYGHYDPVFPLKD